MYKKRIAELELQLGKVNNELQKQKQDNKELETIVDKYKQEVEISKDKINECIIEKSGYKEQIKVYEESIDDIINKCGIDYIIKIGDSLSKIAGYILNDYTLWPILWEDNPSLETDKNRDNPNLIWPGQNVFIRRNITDRERELAFEIHNRYFK